MSNASKKLNRFIPSNLTLYWNSVYGSGSLRLFQTDLYDEKKKTENNFKKPLLSVFFAHFSNGFLRSFMKQHWERTQPGNFFNTPIGPKTEIQKVIGGRVKARIAVIHNTSGVV